MSFKSRTLTLLLEEVIHFPIAVLNKISCPLTSDNIAGLQLLPGCRANLQLPGFGDCSFITYKEGFGRLPSGREVCEQWTL